MNTSPWQRIFGVSTPTPPPTATPTASPPAHSYPHTFPGDPTPSSPTPTPSGLTHAVEPRRSARWPRQIPIPINYEAVTSVGGNLYSFGGTTTGNVSVANSYRFDGTTWTPIAPLPSAFPGSVAVTDGTNIYLVTGATLNPV